MNNFENITNSLNNIKKQYLPSNMIEMDMNDIIFSTNLIISCDKLEKVKKYSDTIDSVDVVVQIIKDNLIISQYYKYLLNVFNLLEYLILNGKIQLVNLLKDSLSKNLNDLLISYIYLENGVDKGEIVKNKIEKINLLLYDNEYLLQQRIQTIRLRNNLLKTNAINTNTIKTTNIKITENNSNKLFFKIKPVQQEKTNNSVSTDLLGLNDFANNDKVETNKKKIKPILPPTNKNINSNQINKNNCNLDDFLMDF